MIELFTAPSPNGRKASIALEELGLDYQVKPIDMAAREQHKPEFLALNPNHKVPVVRDGQQVVWESGAILVYLAEKYGKGEILSLDPAKRMEAIQYAFFQTGGVGPNLGRLGEALRKEGEKNQEMIDIFSGEMDRLLGVLDRILEDGRPYLVGDYSIGDIMHYPWLVIAFNLKAPMLMQRERLVAWIERIGDRPAVQRGMRVPE